MVKRNYWINSINELWKRRNIIYLQGVRRVGKTFLSKSIDGIKYFDCELPSVRNVIEDPESFLKSFRGQKIVIDEIHRLKNPSELLKIAADYYPDTKIIVTGSSIITGTKKFKDTLTGRKKDIFLTPMNYSDLRDFKIEDIKKRLFYGGLPEFFLKEFDDKEYVEWLEYYFAKDIQDLFGVGKRSAFLKFCELVMIRSPSIFEATSYASPCEVSRETIFSYLDILNSTMMVNILRPFSKRRANEIISAPKVYSFDTGFIRAFKGIREFRLEDMGFFWEHLVLNEIFSVIQSKNIYYWRDKQGHEIDFILPNFNGLKIAIECKWKEDEFEPKNFKIFSKHYPDFRKVVVSSDVNIPHKKTFSSIEIEFFNINHLIEILK